MKLESLPSMRSVKTSSGTSSVSGIWTRRTSLTKATSGFDLFSSSHAAMYFLNSAASSGDIQNAIITTSFTSGESSPGYSKDTRYQRCPPPTLNVCRLAGDTRHTNPTPRNAQHCSDVTAAFRTLPTCITQSSHDSESYRHRMVTATRGCRFDDRIASIDLTHRGRPCAETGFHDHV